MNKICRLLSRRFRKMKKIKIFSRSVAAGLASFGCLFPSFDSSTKSSVNTEVPDLSVESAFSDVRDAFGVSSECIQNGIDNVAKQ